MEYFGVGFGVFCGFVTALVLGFVVITARESVLEGFSLRNNIAHYDSKSGKYVQDSLVFLNDSTILIKRK